jgi:hypothetical protein
MLAFLRFLAAVLLLIAVIALVYDGTRTLSAGGMVTTPLIEHWSKLAPASLKATQSSVERYTHPLVWDPVLRRPLLLPAWAVLGILGFLAAYAGRRRSRVNVYAN